MSEKLDYLGNETLVEILYKLKRLNEEDGLLVQGDALAKRILALQSSLISILEVMTGNREVPPMLDEEKAARIKLFLNDLKMAPEVEQTNWKYALDFKRFCDEDKVLSPDRDPPKPSEGSGRIHIVFPAVPSSSLKNALIQKNFSFEENTAFGWSGEFLVELVEQIVLERGEIELPHSKGRFDRWA